MCTVNLDRYPDLIHNEINRFSPFELVRTIYDDRPFDGYDGEVIGLKIISDIVICCYTSRIKYWNIETGELVRTITHPIENIAFASFTVSPDERYMIVSTVGRMRGIIPMHENPIFIWEIASGNLIHRIDKFSRSIAVSHDNKLIAFGQNNGMISICESGTSKRIIEPFRGHEHEVNSMVFTRDKRFLITASADRRTKVWDLETKKQVRTFEKFNTFGSSYPVNVVLLTPDERHVVCGYNDGEVRIYEFETGQCVQRIKQDDRSARAISLLETLMDRNLIIGTEQASVKICDSKTGKCLQTLKHLKLGFTRVQAVDSKKDLIISGDSSSRVNIWKRKIIV